MFTRKVVKRLSLLVAVLVIAILGIATTQLGVYSVPPIGFAPEGITVIVIRDRGQPLFRSPDTDCLKETGSVSILCRAFALSRAPERIVLRLPYIRWAYLASTGGLEFLRQESEAVSPTREPCHIKTFTGRGDHILTLPYSFDGCTRAEMHYDGRRNFIVWALDSDYEQLDLLVNEIGQYWGTVRWVKGTIALEIEADSSWTVIVK